MRFDVSTEIPDVDWDAAVCAFGGNVHHSPIYAQYMHVADPRAVPQFFSLYSDADKLIGVALGFVRRSPRWLMSRLTAQLHLPAIPAVHDEMPEALMDFPAHLERRARSDGLIEVEINSHASRHGGEELGRLGFTLDRRLEFELDITQSEEDIWQGMAYKRRKNIRKAERLGVAVEDMPADEGIDELRRLQGHSSMRIVERGGSRIARKDGRAVDPVTVLIESGLGRLVCARADGEIVSAGLFVCFNGSVYHMLSGHSGEALKCQAPTLLLWETIKRYRRQGASRLNFGGCKVGALEKGHPEHGVYSYKKAFGGECFECTSGRKILRKIRHKIISCARRVLRS